MLALAWAGALLGGLGGAAWAESLVWPLDIQPALSSTFAESRSAGFHAGIDVKTWGKTGYPVKALADGYVVRVRTSPWGYGRAIYHKLADGRVVVYAHLQDFADPIARHVTQAQEAKGLYSVDVWLKPDQVPLRQGQIIARTGQSGAGPPHLHLEIRGADNVPVNPLLEGLAVEDGVAPTLRRLALVPLGVGSLAAGGTRPAVVQLEREEADGHYRGAGSPQVYGTVGVSLLLYDRADRAKNKLAPYRIALHLNGELVSETLYRRVSYANSHQVLLDRMRLEGGAYFNLFRLPGNRLKFYQLPKEQSGLLHCGVGGGALRLEKGRHQLTVEASDVAGNRSRASVELTVNALPRILALKLEPKGAMAQLQARLQDADDQSLEVELAWSDDGADWQLVRFAAAELGLLKWPVEHKGGIWRLKVADGHGGESRRFFAGSAAEPKPLSLDWDLDSQPGFVEVLARVKGLPVSVELVAVDLSGRREIPLDQQDLGTWRGVLPFNPEGGPNPKVVLRAVDGRGQGVEQAVAVRQEAVVPGSKTRISYGDGAAVLDFAAGSAYSRFFPQAQAFTPEVPDHFAYGGSAFTFGPESVALDKKAQIWLRYPAEVKNPEKLGLYWDGGDGKWIFVGNDLDRQRRLVGASVRGLGPCALLVDVEPPQIGKLSPGPGQVVTQKLFKVVADVTDRGAGIGREQDLVIKLDGTPLIAEYDPEAQTVSGRLRGPLAPGDHTFVVEATDMSGNRATAKAVFTSR